jgi:hypothetical protein
MSAAASRATSLSNFFQNLKTSAGAGEDVLIDNARRVSTPIATVMLNQMGLGNDTNAPFKLLENACGLGVVAPVLQQIIKPEVLKKSSILCGDFSDQAIEMVKNRIAREGWLNTEATTVDAQVSKAGPVLILFQDANRRAENGPCRWCLHSRRYQHWLPCRARL